MICLKIENTGNIRRSFEINVGLRGMPKRYVKPLGHKSLNKRNKVCVSGKKRGSSNLSAKSVCHHIYGKPDIDALLPSVFADNFAERDMHSVQRLKFLEPFVLWFNPSGVGLLLFTMLSSRNSIVIVHFVE